MMATATTEEFSRVYYTLPPTLPYPTLLAFSSLPFLPSLFPWPGPFRFLSYLSLLNSFLFYILFNVYFLHLSCHSPCYLDGSYGRLKTLTT